MQLLPYIFFTAAALCLISVTANPLHHRPTAECHFNGHKENGVCKCYAGISGKRCDTLETKVCGPDGACPDHHYCLHKNIDCLYRHDCQDKRGWCMPLDHHA